ncbi:family B DNA polymerase [Pseudomonas aeruginosa]|uniref:family B DNA polymerase n=1 Tax=Pseudomonas aeruginosa TaxID=287 RepID=UPI003D296942
MNNPFVLTADEYKRDINLLRSYVAQNALFLSTMTDQPIERCREFVIRQIKPEGQFPVKDPAVLSVRQDTPANRELAETTFLSYVKEVEQRNLILSPSMIGYERPERIKSVSADFAEGEIAARGKAKSEEKVASLAGNTILAYIKNCEQNARKIGVNSISGMHGSTGNVLYLHTGHSSLTSLCRTATGYGNIWNEKFLAGSRHYYDPRITLYNLLTLVQTAEYDLIGPVVEKYNLHVPSIEETKACVLRSTELYFRPGPELDVAMEFIERLDALQRCAVVYIGDAYHMAIHNDAFMREFVDTFVMANERYDTEPMEVLSRLDSDKRALTNYLNAEIVKGKKWEEVQSENPEGLDKLARTAAGIDKALATYADFIRAFWVTPTLGHSVAEVPSIVRRCVLGSDTDSTIFTTQWWVKWYTGGYSRSKKADGAWYTMTYLTTQGIVHILAKLSANVGVSQEHLHRLAMKNEYGFPVFVLTPRAKHYFASLNVREGDVYMEYKREIKGVALRPSKIPVEIVKRVWALMDEILEAADNNTKMSLDYVYSVIYEYEQRIKKAVENGESTFFETGQIKELYKKMESSPYVHYELWEEVFAPKYGSTIKPPYSYIKVPIEVGNQTEMKQWLDAMEDQDLAARFRKFLAVRDKKMMTGIYLPTQVVAGKMPVEVLAAVNVRKLTYQLLEGFYILLECLGVYQVDDKFLRLVSDFYRP